MMRLACTVFAVAAALSQTVHAADTEKQGTGPRKAQAARESAEAGAGNPADRKMPQARKSREAEIATIRAQADAAEATCAAQPEASREACRRTVAADRERAMRAAAAGNERNPRAK